MYRSNRKHRFCVYRVYPSFSVPVLFLLPKWHKPPSPHLHRYSPIVDTLISSIDQSSVSPRVIQPSLRRDRPVANSFPSHGYLVPLAHTLDNLPPSPNRSLPCIVFLTSFAILCTTPRNPSLNRPHVISPPVSPLTTVACGDSCASIHSVVEESRSAFIMLCIVTVLRSSGRLGALRFDPRGGQGRTGEERRAGTRKGCVSVLIRMAHRPWLILIRTISSRRDFPAWASSRWRYPCVPGLSSAHVSLDVRTQPRSSAPS